MKRPVKVPGGILSFGIFGTTIHVNLGWVLVALLIATSLASGVFPSLYHGMASSSYWAMALIVVIGLGASIILHELAHTLVGRALGVPIHHITLFLFGGASQLEQEPESARAEFAMALAGPVFSVLMGFFFGLLAGALNNATSRSPLVDALGYLAALNFFLAAFNMLPAFPMDGGRILRSLIWMVTHRLDRATAIATFIGQGFGVLLIVLGIAGALAGQIVGGFWWVLMGLFIQFAAGSSRTQLETQHMLSGLNVGAIMTTHLDTALAEMSIADFVEARLFATPHRVYPVFHGDQWIGVVSPEDLLAVPRDQWQTTPLSDICRKASDVQTIMLSEDASTAFDRIVHGEEPLFVLNQNQLVGMVTLKNIQERLRLSQRFARQ